jgi:hypothetical protein
MKRVTLIAAAIVVAVLAMLTTRVAAQDTNVNQRTHMTFSGTVEMPGVTLPAGTYVFRLADTPQRNVVQVLSDDEQDILGQWTFVQAQRPKATGDTVVMFKETKEGMMPAVQYWYYPGESIGKEFIYPKDQAERIAARTGQSVLSEEGRIASSVSSTDSQAPVTNGQRDTSVAGLNNNADANNHNDVAANDSALNNAPAPAQPTAAAGSLTGVRGTSDLDRDNDNRTIGTSGSAANAAVDTGNAQSTEARAELPRTASPGPLVGLIGLLSLAAALGTRKIAAARQ